jgi:hypothetical protein
VGQLDLHGGAEGGERPFELVEGGRARHAAEAEPGDLVERRALFGKARHTTRHREHETRRVSPATAGGLAGLGDELRLGPLDAPGHAGVAEQRQPAGDHAPSLAPPGRPFVMPATAGRRAHLRTVRRGSYGNGSHRLPGYILRISRYRLMSGIDWMMAASTMAMSAALISLPIIVFLLWPVWGSRLPPAGAGGRVAPPVRVGGLSGRRGRRPGMRHGWMCRRRREAGHAGTPIGSTSSGAKYKNLPWLR